MQFAIHKLGFQPEDIILFGWSIGGYSSLVAAAQYPDIKGVVCVVTHVICLLYKTHQNALANFRFSMRHLMTYYNWPYHVCQAAYRALFELQSEIMLISTTPN